MTRTSNFEPTLADIVRDGARRASDGLLVLIAGCGLLALVATLIWRPPGTISLACLAIMALAFGAYGIADRELTAPIRDHSIAARRSLTGIRHSALLLGATAGFVLLLTLLTRVLGTWIS